jgi:hypothetical protein
VQKLHLVGFTTDQKGLILSARRGARSGSFHLTVDDELAEAVEELRTAQAEADAEAEALAEAEATRPSRVESALPVREIQARLRQGRAVADVAKAAGVEPEWVERFAAPVFAERAQVVSLVQGHHLRRARLGPSLHPVAEALRRNLAERGVSMSPDEFNDAWSARQLADGRWTVRFRYRHRNKDHGLRFDLDEAGSSVVAADRMSGQLGYVAPPERPPAKPRPARAPNPPADRPAKRATVTVGFRPDGGNATSPAARERERANEAMRKAAAQHAVEAEKAAARRARERAEEEARRAREAQAAEVRRLREERAEEARQARAAAAKEREREAAARKKAAAAKKLADQRARAKAAKERQQAAAAKKRAAERARAKAAKQRADQARRAEAALRAAERRAAAAAKKKQKATPRPPKAAATGTKAAGGGPAPKRSPRPKAATKTAATKAAATKAAVTKAAITKAPASKAPATRAPASKAPVSKARTPSAAPRTKAPKAPAPKAPATTKAAMSPTETPTRRAVATVAPVGGPAAKAAARAQAARAAAATSAPPVRPAPPREPPAVRPTPPPVPLARPAVEDSSGDVRILGPTPRDRAPGERPSAPAASSTPLLVRAGVVDATRDTGADGQRPAGPFSSLGSAPARERPPGVRRTRPLRAD